MCARTLVLKVNTRVLLTSDVGNQATYDIGHTGMTTLYQVSLQSPQNTIIVIMCAYIHYNQCA